MSPRVTQAHVDARRREILEAAFRCFSEKGLHGTTMQEIANAAGLSAGALYHYFDSKEALVEELAAGSAQRRSEMFETLKGGGGVGILGDVVVGIMKALHADAAEASVRLDLRIWAEALDRQDLSELVRTAFAGLREPVAEFVRAKRNAGQIGGDIDPIGVGRAVTSLLIGLELQKAIDPSVDVESYERTVRQLLDGLSSESHA